MYVDSTRDSEVDSSDSEVDSSDSEVDSSDPENNQRFSKRDGGSLRFCLILLRI